MSQSKPYLDFYNKLKISPVHQDISDLNQHFSTRNGLYRSLGIPSSWINGRSVLEFGPGSGHNSLFTASLNPSKYLLVDGNPTGLAETKLNMDLHFPNNNFEFMLHDIISFLPDKTNKFDLVICEGVIPWQINPVEFVKHVSSFTKDGGIFVATCIDYVSFLPEVLRRLVAQKIAPHNMGYEKRLEILTPIITEHLKTLPGKTRDATDWILDNILITYSGKAFSISDCLDSLNQDFYLLGSSPKFYADWRWYKSLPNTPAENSNFIKNSYFENIFNFLDYRVILPPQDAQDGQLLLKLAEDLFIEMVALEGRADNNAVMEFEKSAAILDEIILLVQRYSDITASAIKCSRDFILLDSQNCRPDKLNALKPFFGRGQQYLSFCR